MGTKERLRKLAEKEAKVRKAAKEAAAQIKANNGK